MNNYNDIKISSNRSFGIVFFVVFLLIALYPLLNNEDVRSWSLIFSFIFLILGVSNSKLLNPLNKIWFKFGLFLGKIISPIVMGIIFFSVVTPIGFIMKLLGKDLINLKFTNEKSYWIEKSGPKSKMKNQF
jgi:predicted membrane protein